MAQIELRINADGPEDLIQTLAGLHSLGRASGVAPLVEGRIASIDEVAAETAAEAPQTRKGRGPNKTKDPQPEAPAASAADEPAETEASPASTAPAASGSDVTIDTVRDVLKKYMATEGKSMLGAQNIMKENFTQADGTPVQQLTKLQPKDFGAYVQALNADLGA